MVLALNKMSVAKQTVIYSLITALAYFISAKLVAPLSLSESESIFAIWPPTGVALSFLLFKGRMVLPGIFLGALSLNLTLSSLPIAFGIAIGNTLGPYVVYLLIKKYLPDDLFAGTTTVNTFILFCVIGSVITSSGGTLVLIASGVLSFDNWLLGWAVWLFGDLIGFLLLTAVYVSLVVDHSYSDIQKRPVLEVMLIIALLFFLSAMIFGSGFFFDAQYPIEYLILFPLLWASIRFKPGVNVLYLFIFTVLAIIGTATGYSSFSMEEKRVSLILLQFFIFTVVFAVLMMTAQRHRMLSILAEKQHLSTIDPLTQISNRRHFMENLTNAKNMAKRYQHPLSLIMLDIDHFKRINDEFGHHKGDLVLVDLANLIKSQIRVTDAFSRFGGEEFMILLPETNKADAFMLAEKLRALIEKHTFSVPTRVTCSFGVMECVGECQEASFEEALKLVDEKLYLAKAEGRNQVAC